MTRAPDLRWNGIETPPVLMSDILLSFDITIHARPDGPQPTRQLEVAGRQLRVLDVEPGRLVDPLPVTFEQAACSLEQLPLLFFEPDGSFVWGQGAGRERWEVDGLLYDGHQQLQYVSLRGKCPQSALDQLLATFGWPASSLVFQLNQQGVFVDVEELRNFAGELH